MSSVPSSAQAICLGKRFGNAKGRRDIVHVAALVWAIMQPPFEFVIEVGSRDSGRVSCIDGGVLSGWK